MSPEAFHLGPLTIRWYGIAVATGFLAGFALASQRARRRQMPPEVVGDLLLWTMLAAIVGARLLYVLQNWREDFADAPLEIIRIDHGGLVFYGGFAGAILAVLIFCRRRRLPLFEVGDLLAPVVPLGQAFGRLGCLLNGCCFGRPWNGCCAIHYPPETGVANVQAAQGLLNHGALTALPVFPIQAALSLMNALIVVILLLAERRFRLSGRLFGLFMVLNGGGRFLLEFGRGDYLKPVAGLTPAQLVCLLLVPLGFGLIFLGGRRNRIDHGK